MPSSNSHFLTASASHFTQLRAAKNELSKDLLRPAAAAQSLMDLTAATSSKPKQNVVGVGIGEKITDGKATGIMAVKLLVRVKYTEHEIPATDLLPKSVNGLPVDVEQVGTFRRFPRGAAAPAKAVTAAMPNPRTRIRPAAPGSSIGFRDPNNQFVMAGTFGALVKKGSKLYVLSNNHVLADENQLPLGSPIFQPGLLDGGNPATDQIAKLTKFVTLTTTGTNKVDCAIAEAKSNLVTNAILFIGAPNGKTDAQIDMIVHKFGRTTSYRVGRITSVDTDVNVGYDIGTVTFQNQIIIVGLNGHQFSNSGDSGSLILERSTQKAVGLLFAGSSTHTIANHISAVLQALSVTLA